MEAASLASTRDDETVTARTLRLLSRVLDWSKVHITLVTRLLHVFEELEEGQRTVSTSIDGAAERRVEVLMLVADVLS
jgi:2-C-methyl-D-erythritol 4-phosphate cytidylyltransferase